MLGCVPAAEAAREVVAEVRREEEGRPRGERGLAQHTIAWHSTASHSIAWHGTAQHSIP